LNGSSVTVGYPAGSLGQTPDPCGNTVNTPDPLFPSATAVIVVAPGACPVANPDADTVAIVWSALLHATDRPVSVRPEASCSCAANGHAPSTGTQALSGCTATDATAAVDPLMSTCALALTPQSGLSADTAQVHGVDPAVNTPLASIAPPVADHTTGNSVSVESAVRP